MPNGLMHRGRDRQTAAVGHRIPGVDAEVEHDLFEIAGAHPDPLDAGVKRQRSKLANDCCFFFNESYKVKMPIN